MSGITWPRVSQLALAVAADSETAASALETALCSSRESWLNLASSPTGRKAAST